MVARHLGVLQHEIGVLATDEDLDAQFHTPAGLRTGLDHNRCQPSPPGGFRTTPTTAVVRLVFDIGRATADLERRTGSKERQESLRRGRRRVATVSNGRAHSLLAACLPLILTWSAS